MVARRAVRRQATISDSAESREIIRSIRELQTGFAGELQGGVAVEHVFSAAGNATLKHGLRRAPIGFLMTFILAASGTPVVVARSLDEDVITIAASGACTVRLWVF